MFESKPYRWFARIFVLSLGLAAIGWGAELLPTFRLQAPAHHVAGEILDGQSFKDEKLLGERILEAVDRSPLCSPAELHDAYVLRIGIADDAIAAANKALIEWSLPRLRNATIDSLSCAPSDAFAWLTLFWLEIGKRGVTPESVNYLRLSYALGPYEAWIALWRNRLAISLFDQLPADLKERAAGEFVGLVDTGTLYSQMAAIFESAAPNVRARLVAQLATAKPVPRQIFARSLKDVGFDVDVPGVERPTRPWQ